MSPRQRKMRHLNRLDGWVIRKLMHVKQNAMKVTYKHL